MQAARAIHCVEKALLFTTLTFLLPGCQTAYYGAMEKLGIEKRDILVDRVADARKTQQDAKEQFEDALEQFIAVTNFHGGELEDQYRNLKAELEDSEAQADKVRARIEDVEQVAEDLFVEWEDELSEYSSQKMRRESHQQLTITRRRYLQLIDKMKRAERKIEPVLEAFQDRVLYLKHNLNSRAIASLRGDRAAIESDIAALVGDMNKSIAEADRFIQAMSGTR